MYCPYCQQPLPDGSSFCSKCGKEIPEGLRNKARGGNASQSTTSEGQNAWHFAGGLSLIAGALLLGSGVLSLLSLVGLGIFLLERHENIVNALSLYSDDLSVIGTVMFYSCGILLIAGLAGIAVWAMRACFVPNEQRDWRPQVARRAIGAAALCVLLHLGSEHIDPWSVLSNDMEGPVYIICRFFDGWVVEQLPILAVGGVLLAASIALTEVNVLKFRMPGR